MSKTTTSIIFYTIIFTLLQASDENDNSHLIQLCAYVQCYQDTVTILLGDSELSEDISGLEALVGIWYTNYKCLLSWACVVCSPVSP